MSCIELDVFKVLDKLQLSRVEKRDGRAQRRDGNRSQREACWLFWMANVTNQTEQEDKAFALLDLHHQNGLL